MARGVIMEEMIEEIESSSNLKFSFEGLEVPLDLILQVIDEKGLDIRTFKVAEITDQYLKYVEAMEELDMEEANKRINQILAMDEEDYTDEILEEMECHEASTHFEDYMNEPIESQTSDNDVQYENCMNMLEKARKLLSLLEL